MLTRRFVALAVALATTAGGCAADKASTADPTTPAGNVERTDKAPVTVSIELTGDLAGRVENETVETQLLIVDTGGEARPGGRLFGLETAVPVVAGNVAFIVGFALRPYEGPGTYAIREGAIQDPQTPDSEKSSIRVVWWPDAAGPPLADFYRREAPCTVRVEGQGERGELTCPRVTNDKRDTHFSVSMRWEFAK